MGYGRPYAMGGTIFKSCFRQAKPAPVDQGAALVHRNNLLCFHTGVATLLIRLALLLIICHPCAATLLTPTNPHVFSSFSIISTIYSLENCQICPKLRYFSLKFATKNSHVSMRRSFEKGIACAVATISPEPR